MRALLLLFIFALTGCLQDELTRCGNDLCPVGDVCTAGGCATPDQATACTDIADGTPCTTDSTMGTCFGGACRKAECGNGNIDPGTGEVCDDGNQQYADGCSGDCRSLETCGNGIVDRAVGEECDDGNLVDDDACRMTCFVPRCGDHIVDAQNGETCDDGVANSNAAGSTCRTNCQPQRCGDHVLDPDEVCDDGNVQSGDGCSGDCISDETCGNGYVDALRGEQCDDNNLRGLSADGCTSKCTVELDTWTDITPPPPAPRSNAAMAYDDARHVTVMYGGSGTASSVLNDTWEYDGTTWHGRPTTTHPTTGVMLYDAARARMTMISADAKRVWQLDADDWHEVTPVSVPGPRSRFGITYDAARQVIVLWGGQLSGNQLNDTWTWDGTLWTHVTPATTSPSGYFNLAMGYDGNRQRVVLAADSTRTWEWDGSDWSSVTLPAAAPVPGLDDRLIFDGQKLYLMHNQISERWIYDGVQWTQGTMQSPPPTRPAAALAYDSVRQMLVMFGGLNGSTPFGDMWEMYRYGGWTAVTPRSSPPVAVGMGFALNTDDDTIIEYGGGSGRVFALLNGTFSTQTNNETWQLAQGRWSRLTTTGNPPSLTNVNFVFDSIRKKFVLFGGTRSDVTTARDTWELTGTAWAQVPTSVLPPTTVSNMFFDLLSGKTLLFDGADLGVVWEWNGTAWAPRPRIDTAPSARQSYSMGFDANRERYVLYGGQLTSDSTFTDELWEYDGTQWILRANADAPGHRRGASMASEPTRGGVLMYGGSNDIYGTVVSQLWQWDGTRWTAILTASGPSARGRAAMTYQPMLRRMVLFAGAVSATSTYNDLWSLTVSSSSTPPDSCASATSDSDGDGLTGCADPDCWPYCEPLCPPEASCPTTLPQCGDGTCDPFENAALCPTDC